MGQVKFTLSMLDTTLARASKDRSRDAQRWGRECVKIDAIFYGPFHCDRETKANEVLECGNNKGDCDYNYNTII